MADPLAEKIQLILDKYQEITATAPDFDDGIELALCFGNLERDKNDSWPRVSWVETGGQIESPRGASGDTEAEAAAMWAQLDVLVWDQDAETARAACFNLIAASRLAIDAPDISWLGTYERGEDRHKNDGVEFKLGCRIRLPAPLDGTRGATTVQVKHHTGTYTADNAVNVEGHAFEQLAWLGAQNAGELQLYGFASSRLAESSEAAANRIITVSLPASTDRYLYSATFDTAGNLWTVSGDDTGGLTNYVAKLTPAQLLTTATVTPPVILTLPGTSRGWSRVRFDRNGDLWVVSCDNRLLKFDAADIAVTGSPTPSVEIEFAGGYRGASEIIFDRRGNMYVSVFEENGPVFDNAIFKLTPAEQVSNPALEPANYIGGFESNNARGYSSMALDSDDRMLWVASYPTSDEQNNRLLAYSLTQFADNASEPNPVVQLFPNWEQDIYYPSGVCFDQSGNLWFSSEGDNTLARIPKRLLKQSGSVTPDVTIQAGVTFAGYFDFQTLAL